MTLLGTSSGPDRDRRTFFQAQVLFWMLRATDGHAKNFSIFLRPGGTYELSPLYDVLSCLPCHRHRRKSAIPVQGKDGHGSALKEHALGHAGHYTSPLAGCRERAWHRSAGWSRRRCGARRYRVAHTPKSCVQSVHCYPRTFRNIWRTVSSTDCKLQPTHWPASIGNGPLPHRCRATQALPFTQHRHYLC